MPDRTKPIPDDVRQALKMAVIDGNLLRMPPMDPKIYRRVNDVLEALGGDWNRKAKGHVFASSPMEKLDQAITTGSYVKLDQNPFDYYPTPVPLVNRLIELAEIEDGMSILEPSAGEGAIALELHKRFPNSPLACVEINRTFCEALAPKIPACQCFSMDFLGFSYRLTPEEQPFDRIVMNPPFGLRQDVQHIIYAFHQLAPGGRLASIASPGFEYYNSSAAKILRGLIALSGSVEKNPARSFRFAGTEAETVIITINKVK